MKNLTRVLFLITLSLLSLNCSNDYDDVPTPSTTVTDADGNVYQSVKIGNQIWMAENLKTTTYNDGTPITEYTFATFGNDWFTPTRPNELYQWASTSDLGNIYENELPFDFYGALYNHYAIQSGKLAPIGWHIPSEAEFLELKNYLSNNGYIDEEAKALKSTFGWLSNGNGTDDFGFNMLPCGYANTLGGATAAQITAQLGSTTLGTSFPGTSSQTRISLSLGTEDDLSFAPNSIALGVGIRCIKD